MKLANRDSEPTGMRALKAQTLGDESWQMNRKKAGVMESAQSFRQNKG